ncbi:MAG: hypothetical protein IPM28_09515 [Chloracidobacterium sp.]|nr:hypothetical protein [Chloracidobacterium sp.]
MKDFVVYHNPNAMGYPAGEHPELTVLTNKRVSDVIGDRVWLLTGEGKPRKFFLCAWFFIDHIDSGEDEGFATCISGTTGRKFDPMIPIDKNAEWFHDLKQEQGNFAWGFSKIKSEAAIGELEKLAQSED